MNIKRLILAVAVIVIAFFITAFIVVVISNSMEKAEFDVLSEEAEAEIADVWQNPTVSTDEPTDEVVRDTSEPVPSVGNIIKEIIPQKEAKEPMAQITIETDRKTKTFDVMQGVDEKTLKKNIGWMESSARPDEDGLCVLMGHRDTDFKILKYAKVGDGITVSYNGNAYKYTIKEIEIIDSDDPIVFDASNGASLVLVTCYPFYYTGSAPRKCLVFAR